MPVAALSDFSSRTMAVSLVPPEARRIGPGETLQRLRFHRGRSLTAAALLLEGMNHEARFGLTCRALNDGIVDGFQIALADQAASPGRLTLSAGFAIGPSGQDLSLGRPVQVDLAALPRRSATDPNTVPPTTSGVGVLVIEPVSGEETRFVADADRTAAFRRTAQLDPGAAPYQDARIVDGIRLTLVMLAPLAVLAMPEGANRAAHLLAEAEAAGAPLASYARTGVALALMGIAPDGRIAWISRHAAARRGGGAPQPFSRSAAGSAMPPRLRQAQVDALLEALNRRLTANPPQPVDAATFRHLPPAGVVPAPGGLRPLLFPPAWRQSAAPIPLSQLDAVFDEAAALAPFDLLAGADEVRWYVPVPDHLFEPDLLIPPVVAQAFHDAVAKFRTDLALAKARRDALRGQAAGVEGLIDSDTIPAYPSPDPDEVAGEPGASEDIAEIRDYAGEASEVFDKWRDTILPGLLTAGQHDMLETGGPAGTRRGLVPLIDGLNPALNEADDFIDFGFTRVQADIYRLRQTLLDNEEATKLATFPVLAGIAKGTNALATSRGLLEHFKSQKASGRERTDDGEGGGGTVPTRRSLMSTTEEWSLSKGFLTGTTLHLMTDAVMISDSKSKGSRDVTAAAGTAAGRPKGSFSMTVGGNALAAAAGGKTPATLQLNAGAKQTFEMAYRDIFNKGRSTAADEIALAGASETRAGVVYASAIPGAFQDLRTITIASRLETPAAVAARTSALRVKSDAFATLDRIAISAEGVTAPIVSLDADLAILTRGAYESLINAMNAAGVDGEAIGALKQAPVEQGPEAQTQDETPYLVRFGGLPERYRKTLEPWLDAMRRNTSPVGWDRLSALTLARELDPDPTGTTDEGAYLASAVAILEGVVAVYRATEARVAVLRAFLQTTAETLVRLTEIAVAWREALAEAERGLAEARQDLRAATALLAEEEDRIAALDTRRRAIVAENVRIMAFARPRHLKPHGAGTTSGRTLAGVYEDPLPAALAQKARLPEDLARMMEVLRDVPVGWFAAVERLMAGYKAPKALDAAFHWAANAASIRINAATTRLIGQSLGKAPPAKAAQAGKRSRAMETAGRIAGTYTEISRKLLITKVGIDLGQIDRQGWAEKRARAEEELSLTDILEGGRETEGAKAALAELDGIERVVSALFAELRRAPVEVRLLWADRLSIYDGDPRLADIATLPGWFSLAPEARHAVGGLHGWLFRRMRPGRAEAEALMSDIVQVALLLAANAETDEIVASRVAAEKTVAPGETVELLLDRGTPMIGAPVWFGPTGAGGIRGFVKDVLQDRARVEIAAAPSPRVTIRTDMQVFVDTRRIGVGGYGR